jgi:hypothetical protein
VALLIAVAIAGYAHKRFPEAEGTVLGFVGILVLTLAASLANVVFYKGRDAARGAWIIAAGMVPLILWLVFGIMPLVESRASTAELVNGVPPSYRAGVIAYRVEDPAKRLLRHPSLPYYLGSMPHYVTDSAAARSELAANKPVYVICGKNYVADVSVNGSSVLKRSGDFVVIGNRLAAGARGD